MSALAIENAARPIPYAVSPVYLAFRLTDTGTYPLGQVEAETLKAAVDAAKQRCFHKDRLLIREAGIRLRQWADGAEEVPFDNLHIFAVRQRARPNYVWEGHVQRRVQILEADPVCVIDALIFATHDPFAEEL